MHAPLASDSEMSLNWYRVPSNVLLSPRSHSTVSLLLLVEASAAAPEAVDCITGALRRAGTSAIDAGAWFEATGSGCSSVLTGGTKPWQVVARRPAATAAARAILAAAGADTPDDGMIGLGLGRSKRGVRPVGLASRGRLVDACGAW